MNNKEMSLNIILKIVCILMAFGATVSAQSQKYKGLGLNLRGYPAGLTFSVNTSLAISHSNVLSLYGGYNVTDRHDWGEHDNEEGGGPGFSIAWRHYLHPAGKGFHFGTRADLWFLNIDWQDDQKRTAAGETDIKVLQPVAEIGYTWNLKEGRYALGTTLALGAEINVDTKGEDVGQGAILLLGVSVARNFY